MHCWVLRKSWLVGCMRMSQRARSSPEGEGHGMGFLPHKTWEAAVGVTLHTVLQKGVLICKEKEKF